MNKALIKILLFAFILRFLLAFLAEHGDVVNHYWWSKDLLENGVLGFYEREIANAMPPMYPAVTIYTFWLSANLHQLVWKVLWFLNLSIKIFPSNLIFWFESERGWYLINKLPAIFADLGIIYLLYLWVKKLKNKKAGLLAACFFAFIPVFWYNSSLWGQIESLFALPMLASFYALHKNRKLLAAFLYALSILIKPTALLAFPVFIFWWFRKTNFKEILRSVLLVCIFTFLIYYPFHPQNTISWIVEFYLKGLKGELSYLVANAFNFWALIYGFDNRPDTTLFLGFQARFVGYFIVLLLTIVALYRAIKQKKKGVEFYLYSAVIISFVAFLFLPKMHERYFYPTLLLMAPLAAIDKKLRKIFWISSIIHLINLYHFWWVPKIEMFKTIFENNIVEKFLIIINIALFIWIYQIFQRKYAAK